MGNCCLPIRFRRTRSAGSPKGVTLLLLGLDNAGKTTIVKRLAGEPIDSVVPTVGFSVIFLRQKGCHVSIYDLGGGPQIRDIWPRYYADAHGVIFVTDARDADRLDECRRVLEGLLRHEQVSGKPVLLLANKQDLEGALDEIDIVDRLNLERVVNEQKCPTLVELCSALSFSKKIDVGIENGYKWLIRSVIREYPSLNGRVLRDLARQEAENKVEVLGGEGKAVSPLKPVRKAVGEKPHLNGYVGGGRRPGVRSVAAIPGLVEEDGQEGGRGVRRLPRQEAVCVPRSRSESSPNSCSTDFFLLEEFRSDLELLNDVPNHSLKNFLVRPKSSGARLYGARSDKKKTHKRKALRKGNKTGPSPLTDISNGRSAEVCRGSEPTWRFFEEVRRENARGLASKLSAENVNPFLLGGREVVEMRAIGESKSVPSSRRNSVGVGRGRRYSMANGKLGGAERFPPSVVPSAKEIILDVRKLSN